MVTSVVTVDLFQYLWRQRIFTNGLVVNHCGPRRKMRLNEAARRSLLCDQQNLQKILRNPYHTPLDHFRISMNIVNSTVCKLARLFPEEFLLGLRSKIWARILLQNGIDSVSPESLGGFWRSYEADSYCDSPYVNQRFCIHPSFMSYASDAAIAKLGGMDYHGKQKMSFTPGAHLSCNEPEPEDYQ